MRVAEREARVTVDPTTIRELHEGAVLAGIGKHDSDDFSDGASRPLDAGLSEPFVGNDLIGLPAKFQPRLRIEVKSRPDCILPSICPTCQAAISLASASALKTWGREAASLIA
jgi:hypothetical protein